MTEETQIQTGNNSETRIEFRKLNLPDERRHLETVHHAYDTEYGMSRAPGDYDVLVDYLTAHSDIYHPLVLFVEGLPAGYIRAYDRLSTSSCDLVMMLDLVYILPEYRDRGLGRKIMDAFLAYAMASGSARIDLLTDLDNPAAVHLYERFEFKGRNRFQMIRFLKQHDELQTIFKEKCENTPTDSPGTIDTNTRES